MDIDILNNEGQGPYTPVGVAMRLLLPQSNDYKEIMDWAADAVGAIINAGKGPALIKELFCWAMCHWESEGAADSLWRIFAAIPKLARQIEQVDPSGQIWMNTMVSILLHREGDALCSLLMTLGEKGSWYTQCRKAARRTDTFFDLWFGLYSGEKGQMRRLITFLGAQNWHQRRGSVKRGSRSTRIWRRIHRHLTSQVRVGRHRPTEDIFQKAWHAVTEAFDFFILDKLPPAEDVHAKRADVDAIYVLLNPTDASRISTSLSCLAKIVGATPLCDEARLSFIIPSPCATEMWKAARRLFKYDKGPFFVSQYEWKESDVDLHGEFLLALAKEDMEHGILFKEPYGCRLRASQTNLCKHTLTFDFIIRLMKRYPAEFEAQVSYCADTEFDLTLLCLATTFFLEQNVIIDNVYDFLKWSRRFKRTVTSSKEIMFQSYPGLGANVIQEGEKTRIYHVEPDSIAMGHMLRPGNTIEGWEQRPGSRNRFDIMPAKAKTLTDRKALLKDVMKDGLALRHASESLKKERDIVELAVEQNGLALRYASDELKFDKRVVMKAVKQNVFALDFTSADIRRDPDIQRCIPEQTVTVHEHCEKTIFEELFQKKHWKDFGPYDQQDGYGNIMYHFWVSSRALKASFRVLRFIAAAFTTHPLHVFLRPDNPKDPAIDKGKDLLEKIYNMYPDIGNYRGYFPIDKRTRAMYLAHKNGTKWANRDIVSRFVNPKFCLFGDSNLRYLKAMLRLRYERDTIIAYFAAYARFKRKFGIALPRELQQCILLFLI